MDESDERWIEEAISLTRQYEESDSESGLLTIVSATQDLLGWLKDPRPYDARYHRGSRRASENDFSLAVDALSPGLSALLDTPARAVEAAVVGIRSRRDDVSRRARIVTLCDQLLEELKSPSVLVACWRDLVAACQDVERSRADLDILRDTFWACLKLRDAALDSFGVGGYLTYLLRDNALEIGAIKARLDGTEPPPFEAEAIHRKAGLPRDERLQLCERVLVADPDLAENIVSLRIKDASLRGITADCGIVKMYHSQWLFGNLFGEQRSESDKLPAELQDKRNRPREFDFPGEENTVFARVDLGHGPVTTAVPRARRILEAMITQAEPSPETWWISRGYVTFRNGLTASSSYAPNEPLKPIYVPHLDHVGGFLHRLQNEGQVVSSNIDPILEDALRLRHQLRQIADGEELVQIMAGVRAVELANSWTTLGTNQWAAFAGTYLSGAWAQQHLLGRFDRACWKALHREVQLGEAEQTELRQIFLDVMSYESSVGQVMNRDRAFSNLNTLSRLYTGHVAERDLRELIAILTDGPSVTDRLQLLEASFKVRLDRLNRVRNAAQHGGPIEMEACQGLGSFALAIGHWANHIVIEAILGGRDALAAAQDRQNQYVALTRELRNGASPARLWT